MGLAIARSQVQLQAIPLPGNNHGQVVHAHVPLSPGTKLGTNVLKLNCVIMVIFCVSQAYLVDGCIERRLSRKSRRKLPYISINDELRRQTSWPPPSQLGCSLVDVMRLENSFFQAEQADEPLLPKSASGGDTVTDEPVGVDDMMQTELIRGVNDVVLTNESCCVIADGGSKPLGLDSKPSGLEDKPLGLDSKPISFDSRPVGLEDKPLGSDAKPVGLVGKPAGLDSSPFNLDNKPVGLHTLSEVKCDERRSYDGTVL